MSTPRAMARALPALVAALSWSASADARAPLFASSEQCLACHNSLASARGEDVSIGTSWRASMMAISARDPYWQAAVRRETLDHPRARRAIEDECSVCHMPMARYRAKVAGAHGRIFAHLPAGRRRGTAAALAADGVSCTVCHQITPAGLGTRASFTGGFVVDVRRTAGRKIYGPFAVDAGLTRIMSSATGFEQARATHVQRSELCASCHTLFTHARDPRGEVVGTLPEQVPYLEWRHSAYRARRSCQDCHMPVLPQPAAISSVLGRPRADFSRHVFRGGNFLMPQILDRYRAQLGVVARPRELRATVAETRAHLQRTTARVALRVLRRADRALELEVRVTNRAGHKLPTAYPSRRVWLHVAVRDGRGATIFESGALTPRGRIRGNDNDDDPRRFERHHQLIARVDQVQIYEAIMADHRGAVTTGLLRAARYLKDNRVLPAGFAKRTASADVAVRGRAAADRDFVGGGDRVRYRVALGQSRGPHEVVVELLYQPVGFRWAQNLARYRAAEPRRFVRYYRAFAGASAAVLARVETRLRRTPPASVPATRPGG